MDFNFQLIILSSDKDSLLLYKAFLIKIFTKFNIKFKVLSLPIKTRRITLNKSPHVNKTAREQFEIKTYKITFKVLNHFQKLPLKYVLLNKFKNEKIKIKKIN